jgi:nicotinamide-nucleotide amidase
MDLAELAEQVVQACRTHEVTVATAESVTAGLVAATLADVPGCSQVLRGGIVAYANEVKAEVLGLPAVALEHVVSRDVAERMAGSVAVLLGATIGAGTTGVAGPGWLDGQPPGSAWIAVHDRRGAGRTESVMVHAHGSRAQVRAEVVRACLVLMLGAVRDGPVWDPAAVPE